MKEVKIYMIVSDQLLLLIIGELFCIDMVCYSDYVEFEVKYVELVEVWESVCNEGINYVVSCFVVVFNYGFFDKFVLEVFDVICMILLVKEDLVNDLLLMVDGLLGEYVEKLIEEWKI